MSFNKLPLPSDLDACETSLYNSFVSSVKNASFLRSAVNLKFEGLKILPLVFRLINKIDLFENNIYIAFSDFGSSALAKRDYPFYSSRIFTYKDILSKEIINLDTLLIAISPQPYDYEEFESMCNKISSRILMINGKLEETSIGVGLVGRERRVNFIKSWEQIFWIEPLPKGAIYRSYPSDWNVYKYNSNGYTFCNYYSKYPNSDLLESDLL